MAEWHKVATTPEILVYRDESGNYYLKSTLTGRFLPKSYFPDYGRLGYGEVVSLTLS